MMYRIQNNAVIYRRALTPGRPARPGPLRGSSCDRVGVGCRADDAATSRSCRTSQGDRCELPAFAAAFLGATQLKHGRFNAWGTIIAVLLLGTGTTGLGLASAPQWAANMFVGVVLIAALAVTGIQRRATGAPAPRRGRIRLRPGTAAG